VNTRDNVPVADAEAADIGSVTFEVPFEPDEPELTVERELGLDATSLERRRREERDDLGDLDDLDDEEGLGRGVGDAEGEEV
jgi:hypothetical protein